MNKYGLWEWATVATLITVVLFGASVVAAQNKAAKPAAAEKSEPAKPQVSAQPRAANPQEESDGKQPEGIKVHGHWTIVVRDANGSVVSRNEFENSLAPNGNAVMSKIMGRQASVGTWQVVLDNLANPNQAVCASSPVGGGCYITEPSVTHLINGPVPFPNLTVEVPTWGVHANAGVVLTGTAKAAKTGAIVTVYTVLNTCAGSVSPATCTTPNAQGELTQQGLAQPISVQAGQSIDVTVVLSFT